MKKIIREIFCLLAICFFTACGNNSTENQASTSSDEATDNKGLEDKSYIIGLDDTFAPMGFRDEKGELVGFDIDIAKDLANKLDIEIEFLPIDWSMKETELNQGNIDMIWNGYSITEERKEKVAFSDPYMSDRQFIVTLKESNINSKKDLAGKTITVQENSSAIDAMNKDQEFVDSIGQQIEYPTNNECFADIESKRCDAIVIDELYARYYIKTSNKEDKFKILEETFDKEDFAIGMRKEDKALLETVNKALKEQREDGTYDKIYKKWLAE